MKCVVANAFSINMLARQALALQFLPVTVTIAGGGSGFFLDTAEGERIGVKREDVDFAVGHADTAAVFSRILGIEIPMNRQTFQGLFMDLVCDEVLLVGQYRGPRLAEGAKELPAGATIEWWLIRRAEDSEESLA